MKGQLEKIFTKDKIALSGLFFKPEKQKNKAVLFIHGFPGNFYVNHEIINGMADKFYKSNVGFFSMNTRGHDIMNISFKKNNKPLVLGSALEKFEDCVLDIDTGIKFLNKQGFNQIVLIGISGGADKVGYYLSKKHNKLITGGIFLSPGSNILIIKKELKNKFKPLLKKALRTVKENKGNELIIEPEMDFPVSCQRFISLYSEESNENVFPFHNKKAKFKSLSKIKAPILIIMGDRDSYLYNYNLKSIAKLLEEKTKNAKKFNFEIVRKANHSFKGKEKKLVAIIGDWINEM